MGDVEVDLAKRRVRERVWTALERSGATPGDAHERIPDFHGADEAAGRLAELPEWRNAHVVKAVPDKPQRSVRAKALEQGKTLYMAAPKLAAPRPFVLLDPATLPVTPWEAASRRVAMQTGQPVELADMRPVDLVVCGSVAVNDRGTRLGKGAGYSDIEVALLHEAGLIGPHTMIVTTVHPLQVVDDELPETAHDFSVDLIVTPDMLIRCGPPRRPRGVDWSVLSEDQIAAIPVLAAPAGSRVGRHARADQRAVGST